MLDQEREDYMQIKTGTRRFSRRSLLKGGAALAAAAMLSFSLAACGSTSDSTASSTASTNASVDTSVSGSITAVGSTALQPLVEAAAEQYMGENPNVTITVQGGGSGQGLTQVSQGAVQIGNSDVEAADKNIDDSNLTDNKVCVVGFAPVVNKEVGVTDITSQELVDIFTGKITNWSELGGADQEIVVINRASGSGTRASFEKYALNGETPVSGQEQDSSGTVLKMVAETPGSISYLAFSYVDDTVTALSIDGVEPTDENVTTGKWNIWSYEHMYTAKNADGATQAFIDYMNSDAVQGSLVESLGYIPISDMKVTEHAA
jgi:phosphate transport system substrate-binding protein